MSSNDDSQKPGGSRERGAGGALDSDRLRRRLEQKLTQGSREPNLKAMPEWMVPEWAREEQGEEDAQGQQPEAGPESDEVPLPLPQVQAPSLENLRVTVPPTPDVTQDDLLLRFHELVREHGVRRPREVGEPIAMGDEVTLDTLGYANGELIPFSAREELQMELAPQALLPGLAEALEGTLVGESREVDLTLPDDHPLESLRGAQARFLVDVLAAEEVELPDAESPEFLAQLGRGSNLDEVMESLLEEMIEERADELWLEAQELVIDEVVRRTELELSSQLVNEEIYRRWNETEAPLLRAKNFAPDELQAAVVGWLEDEATRIQAERDLRASLAFRAIIQRDGLKLTPEKLDEVLEVAIEPFGLSLDEAREALEDPEVASRIRASAMQVLAFEHVMEHAQIQFEGGEEPVSGRSGPRA